MPEDKSSVDRLNDTLYSRTRYSDPKDSRSPMRGEAPEGSDPEWKSENIDTMLKERRVPDAKPTKMKRFFMLSILFFIGAFALALYVYIGGGNFVSTKNVDILVTGPSMIEAGQPLALTVTVENKNNAELEMSNLAIQYPEGTRVADDTTQALTRDRVDLGIVKAGGESVHVFNSAIFGQKGDIKQVKILLEYKIKGSSASFYKDKTYEVTIGDTPVAIGIEKPDTIVSGQLFTTKIVIAANTTDVLKNVIVRAEYPYGFTAQSSDPKAISADNVWSIGDLSPGDKKTITLIGSMTGVDADQRTFRFYAGVADPGRPDLLKSLLVSTTETFSLSRPTVGLLIKLNGSSDGSYVAPMGSEVSATIAYQNNAPEKLTNVHIALHLDGTALNKDSVRPDSGGFYDSQNNQVIWPNTDSLTLSQLDPGESGQVQVYFSSLSNLPVGKSQEIALKANISGTPSGDSSRDLVTNSTNQKVKISSTVNLTGKALYSRGPFKNIGPIPPKAEATTTYTAVFDLGNTQNEVRDGKLTAKLGQNVTWIPEAGTDGISYDQGSNTVTWTVGALPSGTGFTSPIREASFHVALSPSIGQIGTTPTLVTAISFVGTDSFTNLPVTASLINLNIRLTSDPKFVQGDDVVVK
jgi:hypothetical protein